MMRLVSTGLAAAALTIAGSAYAMTPQSVRVVLWTHGEALNGDDLLPANEAVVDYLDTLTRPADPNDLDGKRYTCQAKTRTFQTAGTQVGSTTTSLIEFQMVYELKGCVPAGS